MVRHIRLIMLTAAVLWTSVFATVFAGDYFERDGVAIGGYDPVAYFTEQKPVKGSPEFQTVHRGSTFQFSSAAHRDAFAAEPDKYAPQYGGYCAYGVAKDALVKVEPDQFTIRDGKLYLNYDAGVQKKWLEDPAGYIKTANGRFDEMTNDLTREFDR